MLRLSAVLKCIIRGLCAVLIVKIKSKINTRPAPPIVE